MKSYSVVKEFRFEAAHRLEGHEGKCRRLHGHSYRLEVELAVSVLQRKGPARGMVVDFDTLTQNVQHNVINRWDHKFLVSRENITEGHKLVTALRNDEKIDINRDVSTAEYLAEAIHALILPQMQEEQIVRVTLWETAKCQSTFRPV